MEAIFKTIGYTISTTPITTADKVVDVLYIKNPDGTPRWIWGKTQKQPLFLKFYSTSSIRAKIFAVMIRILFCMKLQKLVFPSKKLFIAYKVNPLFNLNDNWALFTGTVGPNNKAILYANKSFYKIATTPSAQNLIHNEHQMLNAIKGLIPSLVTPESFKISDKIIRLTDVSKKGERSKNCTSAHLNILSAISATRNNAVLLKDWILFNTLKNDFKNINDDRIPVNMIRKMNLILENTDPNEKITLSLSHGDFTQWNMYKKEDTIALYDWELASFDRSKAFDYFHFIIQNGIMVERKSWSEIYKSIKENCSGRFATALFDNDIDQLNQYLKWYLLVNCMYYLKVYAAQPKWHVQIEWLLLVWNEALNAFLVKEKSPRELLIMDVFDSIQNQEYAALKLDDGFPEALKKNSDIDLIMTKKSEKALEHFLKNHALVSKITTNEKSFMNSILVFLKDGSLLALDLIRQLKVRNLEILDAKKTIKNSSINNYGIKNASNIDTARYIALFYILNGSRIPEKYANTQNHIKNSEDPLDLIIQTNPKSVLDFIKNTKQNNSFHYIQNTLNYYMDTIKNSLNNRGFIITFSGVDGAGKSTVIENIAVRIEKQLRKKVVILRHRPSVLPILSVWTKGKEKAHQDAIESLPRQGKNNSLLSSLFRFSYYYMDYLLGQFVVYFKHIIRGHVVIYDRYYFDFINDSKRSNIELPKNLSVFCYRFLLKPKFNFFLFADADIILKRKQELSKTTIEKLTKDYHLLFESLGSKSRFSVYETINNIELEATLNRIVTTLIQPKK
jgi:thymidylate kinase